MADMHVHGEPLMPRTRIAMPWENRRLYIPSVADQIAILRRFGREKDLQRAARLERLL